VDAPVHVRLVLTRLAGVLPIAEDTVVTATIVNSYLTQARDEHAVVNSTEYTIVAFDVRLALVAEVR
jgi:hypothetical protein